MKSVRLLAYGVLIGLLAGGILWLTSQPKRGDPVQLQPPPEPAPIQVYVTGEVNQPGVVKLPWESRVNDAVNAAGGFTALAEPQVLNLAALLVDGQKIVVPPKYIASPGSEAALEPPAQIIYPIDLNTADQSALESLPGIGPGKAQAIIVFREEHGPFKTLDDLDAVDGIGSATIADIQDLVVVNP